MSETQRDVDDADSDTDDDCDDCDDCDEETPLDRLRDELALDQYTDQVGHLELLTDVEDGHRLSVGWKGEVPIHIRSLLADREQSNLVIFYPTPYTAEELAVAIVELWMRRLPEAGIEAPGYAGPNGQCTAGEVHLSIDDPRTRERAQAVVDEVAREYGVPIRLHFAQMDLASFGP